MRLAAVFSAFVLIAASGAALAQTPAGAPAGGPANRPPPMAFVNPPFEDGGVIPDKYTAKAAPAAPVSPALTWTDVPAGTQSFTLIMHDLDVVIMKSATDNLHWLAFNIPGTATSLPEGLSSGAMLPDGTMQLKTRTANGYMGPGAGPGLYHHYVVELYALDSKLPLTDTATHDQIIAAMAGHVLGKAVMVGRFHR